MKDRVRTPYVLVVDDDRVARAILSRVLEREGYRIAEAVDGADAIEKIDAERPDLILLDVTMPRVSGLEVLHLVRQRFGALDLPIVMTSARSEVDDVLAALHLGANDYITKPVDFGLLIRRAAAALGHRRRAMNEMMLRRRLDLLLRARNLCVSVHDPDGRFIEVSDALCAFLGRSREELLDLSLHDLFHPQDAIGLSEYSAVLPDTYRLVVRMHRGENYGWCDIEQQALRDGVTKVLSAVQAVWRDREGDIPVSASRQMSADVTALPRRSFAFTPAPVERRLSARTQDYGPPIDVETTPMPSPRADTVPPIVVPGVGADEVGLVRARLRDGPDA